MTTEKLEQIQKRFERRAQTNKKFAAVAGKLAAAIERRKKAESEKDK